MNGPVQLLLVLYEDEPRECLATSKEVVALGACPLQLLGGIGFGLLLRLFACAPTCAASRSNSHAHATCDMLDMRHATCYTCDMRHAACPHLLRLELKLLRGGQYALGAPLGLAPLPRLVPLRLLVVVEGVPPVHACNAHARVSWMHVCTHAWGVHVRASKASAHLE